MAEITKSAPSTPVPTQTQSSGQTRPWTTPIPETWNTNSSANNPLSANSVGYFLIIANGFGFTIPVDSTIIGILVEISVRATPGGSTGVVTDSEVVIVKGGVLGSINRASAEEWDLGSSHYISHGSASDLWGQSWTPDDINASNFGAAVSPGVTGSSDDASVNGVRITIYYVTSSLSSSVSSSISSSISSSVSSSISSSPSSSLSPSTSISASPSTSLSPSTSISQSPSTSTSLSSSISASPSISLSRSSSISSSISTSISSSPSPSQAIGKILGRNNDTDVIKGVNLIKI